jgi:acyl-CoA hydrolase
LNNHIRVLLNPDVWKVSKLQANICASGWSASYCVTVYVDGIRFYEPVLIGQVGEVRVRVNYTSEPACTTPCTVMASRYQ